MRRRAGWWWWSLVVGSPTCATAQQQPSRGVALALRGQALVYWEHPWEHPRHKKGR